MLTDRGRYNIFAGYDFHQYAEGLATAMKKEIYEASPDYVLNVEYDKYVDDLPPIFSPGIMRLSPVLGSPTLHLQSHSHHRKKRLRPAEPCERSRTEPRSSAQTPLV